MMYSAQSMTMAVDTTMEYVIPRYGTIVLQQKNGISYAVRTEML
jgi:hypothetical protein